MNQETLPRPRLDQALDICAQSLPTESFRGIHAVEGAKYFGQLEALELSDGELGELLALSYDEHPGVLFMAICDCVGRNQSFARVTRDLGGLLEKVPSELRTRWSTHILAWLGWNTPWSYANLDHQQGRAKVRRRQVDQADFAWLLDSAGEGALDYLFTPSRRALGEYMEEYVPLTREALDYVVARSPISSLGITNLSEEHVMTIVNAPEKDFLMGRALLVRAVQRYPRVARALLYRLADMADVDQMRLNVVDAGSLADAMGDMDKEELMKLLKISDTYAIQLCLFGHFEGVWPRTDAVDEVFALLGERDTRWWAARLYPSQKLSKSYRAMLVDRVPGLAWGLGEASVDTVKDLLEHIDERLATCGVDPAVAKSLFNDRENSPAESVLSLNEFLERIAPLSRALS